MKFALYLAASATCIGQAYSWGAMGHAAVAYVATNYLTSSAKDFTAQFLNGSSLADVASWADSYRYTADGAFSAHLHYVDAMDSPPSKCNVKFERDCPDGCVISAIANYTTRVLDDTLSVDERTKALKWIIHFTGDITQPLHTENVAVGGNEITVYWGNVTKTNLHAIWDRQIPETLAGGSTLPFAQSFANGIIQDIESGIYSNMTGTWTSCGSIKRGTACPKAWAQEANSHVCTYVLQEGIDALSGKDLSGDYYTKAAPIAREQIAKGGYRLGKWLNAIAKANELANDK